jgi:hypothetical protein
MLDASETIVALEQDHGEWQATLAEWCVRDTPTVKAKRSSGRLECAETVKADPLAPAAK